MRTGAIALRGLAAIPVVVLAACAPQRSEAPRARAEIAERWSVHEDIDRLCALEARYRFPNSMAATGGEDQRELEVRLVYGLLVAGTAELAPRLGAPERASVRSELRGTGPDDVERAVCLLRLLLTAGEPAKEALAAVPAAVAASWGDVLAQTEREARLLHAIGPR